MAGMKLKIINTSGLSVTQAAQLQNAVDDVTEWLDLKLKTGRYSFGLVMELMRHQVSRSYNVHTIYDEIGWLEVPATGRGVTKPAAPFTGSVLLGLWHKHHHQAGFICRNLMLEMHRKGVMEGILSPHYGRYLDEVWPEILDAMTIKAYECRGRERRMTGEWIVYEPSPSGNYYITLGHHTEADVDLKARVDEYKKADDWLAAQQPFAA